jgi:hypothetical protein
VLENRRDQTSYQLKIEPAVFFVSSVTTRAIIDLIAQNENTLPEVHGAIGRAGLFSAEMPDDE